MPKKETIEISIVRVLSITLGPDPADDALITFSTGTDANLTIRLPAPALAELEAIIGKAGQIQAVHATKQ